MVNQSPKSEIPEVFPGALSHSLGQLSRGLFLLTLLAVLLATTGMRAVVNAVPMS